jgi:hypothetical protein
MATVQGIREKCHLPIYDSVSVGSAEQLRDVEPTSTLKFFVNVQNKTKLETNLQSASLLPHYNTFEARAMRVVISDLPPEFPEEPTTNAIAFPVTDEEGFEILVDDEGNVIVPEDTNGDTPELVGFPAVADFDLGLDRTMELLAEARTSADGTTFIDVDDDAVFLKAIILDDNGDVVEELELDKDLILEAGGIIILSIADLELLISELDEKQQPPKEQIRPNNGSGTIIGKLVYNTVTTLYVGEKIMIQMPTWFFPAGAGPYSENSSLTTHGEPSPMATFRFAEPIFIDKQQNFRVELEVPDTDTLKEIQRIYGPLNIWVVLDGYMTRDVQ